MWWRELQVLVVAYSGLRWGEMAALTADRVGARIEDVSRLLGHSTVRVTQDLYISPDGDLYERFYRATA